MTELSPDVARLVALFAAAGAPPFPSLTPEAARAAGEAGIPLAGEGPPVHAVRDLTLAAGDGSPLHGRSYRPTADEPAAVIVWLHGGGWVIGSPRADDAICRTLARESGALVINADYRHAPEHPFPAAADDALAAVRGVAATIAGGRPLVVAGSSAGANLAAVTAIRARDARDPEIALQLLIYPVTDHDFTRPSYGEYAEQIPLGRADMEWYWNHYVPRVADRDSPLASPLRTADLSGLPPAYITVAGADPLHDEGVAYARALSAAGNEVQLREDPGAVHGYVNFLAHAAVGGEVLAEAGARVAALSAASRASAPH